MHMAIASLGLQLDDGWPAQAPQLPPHLRGCHVKGGTMQNFERLGRHYLPDIAS